jgi:hypothetical protein
VTGTPGIVVGKVVSTGQTFIQSWEDLSLDIWGPRTGKSTSRVTYQVTPGPAAAVTACPAYGRQINAKTSCGSIVSKSQTEPARTTQSLRD